MIHDEYLLKYFEKLRDELVSQQNLRMRVQIFKLTAIGLLWYSAARSLTDGQHLVAIGALALAPVVAAIFDFSIAGCGVAIKKIGHHIRTQIEPELDPLPRPYETFMGTLSVRLPRPIRLAFNIAFTVITIAISAGVLFPGGGLVNAELDAWGYEARLPWVLTWVAWLALSIIPLRYAMRFGDHEDDFSHIDGVDGARVFVTGQYRTVCMVCRHPIPCTDRAHDRRTTFAPFDPTKTEDHRGHWLVWRFVDQADDTRTPLARARRWLNARRTRVGSRSP